jgi:uracil phosphoribosyltransferase
MSRAGEFENLTVVEHPFVAHRLRALRDVATHPAAFRQLTGEISSFLAFAALGDLGMRQVSIVTPVAEGVVADEVAETVLLVPILRAGLGMVPAIQAVVPLSEVAHVGLRRDDDTLQSAVYLNRLPADLSGRRVVVCDPMLATGGSLAQVCDMVRDAGSERVVALCIVASLPGLTYFTNRHRHVHIVCAAVDPSLDQRGYIVPGLGDAGDRLFGPPD